MGWFADLRARYDDLLAEYGQAALATYLTLFFGTWIGFWIAIKSGIEIDSAAGSAGTIGGAYIATKLTQPIRIGATLVLTPPIVGAWRRLRGAPPEAPEVPPEPPASSA